MELQVYSGERNNSVITIETITTILYQSCLMAELSALRSQLHLVVLYQDDACAIIIIIISFNLIVASLVGMEQAINPTFWQLSLFEHRRIHLNAPSINPTAPSR